MPPQHNAPLWYRLYAPLESTLDLYSFKAKYWIQSKIFTKETEQYENVTGKVVVITGANSGLGLHTAIAIARKGAVVLMGCRNLEKGEQAKKQIIQESGSSTVELYHLDLCDMESVRRFSAQVLESHKVIDVLINNGGISLNNREQQMTNNGWDLTMATNHLGHFLLTNLLLNAILASPIARVVAVSSTGCITSSVDTSDLMMQNVEDLGFMNTKPYQNSKLCNALFIKKLAELHPTIKAFSVCPGYVETNLLNNYETNPGILLLGFFVRVVYMQKVEFGVEAVMRCALSKKLEGDSGAFFRLGKRLKQVEKMLKGNLMEEVWKESEKFSGLKN